MKLITFAAAAACVFSVPVAAQSAGMPGAPDAARVQAGRYVVDPDHTQVIWAVNHMGISPLTGAFGATGGWLEIDPAHPERAKVSVDFTIAEVRTTSHEFTRHFLTDEIMDVARFPGASFTSTAVVPRGKRARISGNLTVHGVTRPVILDAEFFGAGVNPRSKEPNLGFVATARLKRSEFGINYAIPLVSDEVTMEIHGAFKRAP